MAQVSKINMGGIDYDIRDKVLEQEVANIKPIVNQGTINNAADEEDLTSENNLLKLKDRSALNGMGFVILRKNMLNGKNTLTQDMISQSNTIYIVRYDFVADSTVHLPEGSEFKYDGGSIIYEGNQSGISDIKTSQIGLIPNLIEAGRYNAEKLAEFTNGGYAIQIDGEYYLDGSEGLIGITNNIKWHGNGRLIKSNAAPLYEIKSPISIFLEGIFFDSDFEITPEVNNGFLVVNESLYNESLIVRGCKQKGVRLYTHIAKDVDQTLVKDGVRNVEIYNNEIYNIGYCAYRFGNCLIEYANIHDNYIHNYSSIVFDFSVNNEYSELGFARTKNVIIEDNLVTNEGYVIEDVNSVYHTLAIVESAYCRVSRNTFKDIILTKPTNVECYSVYISSNIVEFTNNTIHNVVGMKGTGYGDIFKCKNTVTDGYSSRIIENNTYILDKTVIQKYETPSNMGFCQISQFQSDINYVLIQNNTIDAYCAFAFGTGEASHDSYIFRGNKINVRSIRQTYYHLVRAKRRDEGISHWLIEDNTLRVAETPTLFNPQIAKIMGDGNELIFKNNDFECYSMADTLNPSIMPSYNGDIYGFVSPFRLYGARSENLNIHLKDNIAIYLYVNNEERHLKYRFPTSMPTEIDLIGSQIALSKSQTTGTWRIGINIDGVSYYTYAIMGSENVIMVGKGERHELSRTTASPSSENKYVNIKVGGATMMRLCGSESGMLYIGQVVNHRGFTPMELTIDFTPTIYSEADLLVA